MSVVRLFMPPPPPLPWSAISDLSFASKGSYAAFRFGAKDANYYSIAVIEVEEGRGGEKRVEL